MDKKPSIFLSHSHFDKHFVKRLAEDLTRNGVKVWLDEAEMGIGDSLIEKIREGIDSMDYLGAVISQHSVKSSWVRKEIDVAMNQEIEGHRIKVLPILIDECDLPGFLLGKIYADFRKPEKYDETLETLLKRFGIDLYASPLLKRLGLPTHLPDSAFTSYTYLKVYIVFYDGKTFYFGINGVGATNAPDNTKVSDLVPAPFLKLYGIDSFDLRTLRVLHIASESWVENFRTLGEAGVSNGDYLVYTLGEGSSQKVGRIATLFSLALEKIKNDESNSGSAVAVNFGKSNENPRKPYAACLVISLLIIIVVILLILLLLK